MTDPARAARLTAAIKAARRLLEDDGVDTLRVSLHLDDIEDEFAFLLAHVETLEREKAALTAALHASERFRAEDAGHSLVAQNELRQQRDTAHAALRTFGTHEESCIVGQAGHPCTCGLDAALAASAPQKEEPR
jgi:hypothetical protein